MNNGVLVVRLISVHKAGNLNCGRQVAVVIKNMKRKSKLEKLRSRSIEKDETVRRVAFCALTLMISLRAMLKLFMCVCVSVYVLVIEHNVASQGIFTIFGRAD